MSNSYSKEFESVLGSWRVSTGTLVMGDSSSGDTAGTGMDQVYQVLGTGSQGSRLSYSGSGIMANTCQSGASYQVIVFGR